MAKLIYEASQKPHTYWYVSPSYSAAKRTVWDDPDLMPRLLPNWAQPSSSLFRKNETELRIHFPQSGGNIYFIGADRPDLMRGPNPFGVVSDEYSVQRKEVWEEVIQPILLANPESWGWFLFTPRGKNHAYDLMLSQQNNPNWLISTMNVLNSKIFLPEQVEQIKAQMPEQSFRQEFMCEFLEGEGSVFRHLRQIFYQPTSADLEVKPGHLYVCGVDLGKSQDYTVITVYDRTSNYQVYQDRFNILEWPYQKAKIASISRKYNNALVVLDVTGVGSPIYDDLNRAGVPIKPVHFTNQIKKDLIEKLSIAIEQRYIRMLPSEETLQEFDSYEFNYTKSGLVSYNARLGMHDDIVIAHALAVSELQVLTRNASIQAPTRLQDYLQGLLQPKDPDLGLAEWAENDIY